MAVALSGVAGVDQRYFQKRAEALQSKVRNDTPSKEAQSALYLEKVNRVPRTELPEFITAFLQEYPNSITLEHLEKEYSAGRSAIALAYKAITAVQPQIKTIRRPKMSREKSSNDSSGLQTFRKTPSPACNLDRKCLRRRETNYMYYPTRGVATAVTNANPTPSPGIHIGQRRPTRISPRPPSAPSPCRWSV